MRETPRAMIRTVHVISGLDNGGAEAVLSRLCLALRGEESTVVVLGGEGKYTDPLRAGGVQVLHLNMPRGCLTFRGLFLLYMLIRRQRPDIVQTWMYHGDLVGGIVARIAGCREVIWNVRHTELEPGSTGRSTRIIAHTCALLSHFIPRRIVVCADRAREVHRKLGYQACKFITIANGYDIERFKPDVGARIRVRRELGVPCGTTVIGLVGRWNPQKDHKSFLDAVSRLDSSSEIITILVGPGCDPDNRELQSLVNRFGLRERVLLLGPRADIPGIMNALDLHVLSSSHGEAFPNVVAEAMASGTPCVVTDVGDAALIVGSTGWVVPPRDPSSLARAITTALRARGDGSSWEERRSCARARITDHFSLNEMVAQYKALWSQYAVRKS